jgi:hypothetical protein
VLGPLSEGQIAISNACLTGNSSCAAFNVFGARPELATLAPISGTNQSTNLGSPPAPVILRVLDVNGNPMAGASVAVHQSLFAGSPPCPRHGRCAQAQLLATQALTVTAALDGSVTVTPLAITGVATSLKGLAAIGNADDLLFTVEQHP